MGANGSGKSNVVDAIRWSMGEQSARDLRGQRAEDVIYAGPRRVLGSAEVSLALEGEGGEQGWAEMAVARRLFRSGESEYLINRRRERLRDLQDALRGAGIDNPRFVVVNQGMTDFLLSATPGERRALLEQAAGLSAYRARRDEAMQKLQTAETNVLTVETILTELEPRIRSLRRQARAVEDRANVQARLRTLQELWYAWHWRRVRDTGAELTRDLDSALRHRRAVEDALHSLEEVVEVELQRERQWQAGFGSAVAALHLAEREAQDARHALSRLEDSVRAVEEGMRTSAQRRAETQSAVVELEERRTEVMQEGATLETGRLSLESDLAQVDTAYTDALKIANTARDAVEAARHAEQRARSDLAHVEHECRAVEERQERALARSHDLAGVATALESDRASLASELERAESDLSSSLSRERDAREQLSRCDRELDSARRRLARAQQARQRAAAQRSGLAERLHQAERSLAHLEEHLDSPVLTFLEVDPGWEAAIAALAGSGSASLGVTSEFLCWRDALGVLIPRNAVWADTVVKGERELPAVILGAVLVENDEDACALWRNLAPRPAHLVGSPPVQVVTRAGTRYGALGRESAGDDDRGARYLRGRMEVQRLSKRLATASHRLDRLVRFEADIRPESASADERRREAQIGLDDARSSTSQARTLLAALEGRLARIEREIEESRRQSDALAAESRGLQAQRLDLERQREGLSAILAKHERGREEAIAVLTEREKAQEELRSGRAALRGRLDGVMARREAQERVAGLVYRDLERRRAELDRFTAQAEEMAENLAGLRGRLEASGRHLADLEAVVEDQRRHVAAVERARPAQEDRRRELHEHRESVSVAVGRHERLAARLAEVQSERMRLSQEIAEELAVQVDALPEPLPEPPSQEELRRLRSRAGQYAEADAAVVEECREAEVRFSYLTEQVTDLRATADGLREVVRVADAEMRLRFRDALGSVSAEFARVFDLMLPGGSASLEVCDDDGGIEVHVALPGKRPRSSAAFSGGERALIATSLLFAVLHIRPTPFVVLDEVDAALDETNVDRYLVALRDVSTRTQVLVVTHNRATMAAASVLYGLTLDADGVSSVLSLRLEDYEAAG